MTPTRSTCAKLIAMARPGIEVRVAQSDMGKVIGKQGRTVRALRSLVYAAGVKQHRRFVLDVVE